MCGFVGVWQLENGPAHLHAEIGAMTDALAHRGPDDAHTWVDGGSGMALGFRRLAILDRSLDGRQPMVSASGRYVIAFNGEMYNFLELRDTLVRLGHRFCGGSDTEVMLAAFEQWGIEPSLRRFAGMFAFALWDRYEQRLVLARDRLGIKPLYYGSVNQNIVCGSELKALCAWSEFAGVVNREALTLFMRYGYVPSPFSIYHGIRQLPPGCMLVIDSHGTIATPQPYWSLDQAVQRGHEKPFVGDDDGAIGELTGLLGHIIGQHMLADVPLGAFLSGGIDSSLVVALMQAQSTRPIKTFSIGFRETAYNEAHHARAIAAHLGTHHTELYVTAAEAQAVIPRLPEIYDEPFADASQIPTLLLSQLTRGTVTVSLSGDGGDELFGGYTRYSRATTVERTLGWIPAALRHRLGSRLHAHTPANAALLHKIADALLLSDRAALYQRLVSLCAQPTELVLGGYEPPNPLWNTDAWHGRDYLHQMMRFDTVSYLPDDILVKVDRASMAVGLEARVPLLDHRFVEFSWRLPVHFKRRRGQSKWLLRQVLARYVPRQLWERPKQGFAVPVGVWLRGPLREWAESLLDKRRLRDEGFFDADLVGKRWNAHLAGEPQWEALIWNVLMFQAWHERWQTPQTRAHVVVAQNTMQGVAR